MNITNLKNGDVLDLKGTTITISNTIEVDKGNITIKNGTIKFSKGVAVFKVNKKETTFNLSNLNFKFTSNKGIVVETWKVGKVNLDSIIQDQGNLWYGHGADSVNIKNCYSTGKPWKYYFCNFSDMTNTVRWDNSGINKQILQGKSEAAVRIMQVYDCLVTGVKVKGSNYKQAVQDRPGGEPGTKYKKHIWKNCEIIGGLDVGNFEDTSDVNYPFGVLDLSRWEQCKVDHIHKTYGGHGAYGVKKFEWIS